MYQDIEYDGIKGSSLKIYARERPSIPAARVRREQIIIPGRDGAVYESDGTFEPTEIEVQFNYIGKERENQNYFETQINDLSQQVERLQNMLTQQDDERKAFIQNRLKGKVSQNASWKKICLLLLENLRMTIAIFCTFDHNSNG